MDKPILRRRIVGAVIVVLLSVTLYPLFFDIERRYEVDRTSQIPPRDILVEPIEVKSAPVVAVIADRYQPEQIFNSEKKVETIPSDAPILNEQGLPNGWLVKVGSFGDEKKAEKIAAQLRDMNIKAYSKPLQRPDNVLYRVLAGPYLNKDEIAEVKQKIDKKLSVQSIIVEFQP